jgi:hypothetical protein
VLGKNKMNPPEGEEVESTNLSLGSKMENSAFSDNSFVVFGFILKS